MNDSQIVPEQEAIPSKCPKCGRHVILTHICSDHDTQIRVDFDVYATTCLCGEHSSLRT